MTPSTGWSEIESRVNDFETLLKDIDTLDDKRKRLMKEIYENALLDRQNAYVMFLKMVEITKDASTEHAVHGKTIATYIEKMSRANDQLIKLVELLEKASGKPKEYSADDLYKQILQK